MKIAVTSAFGWPYVRRGNRVIYELASYLASQGHEVHFITTKPGELRREKVHGNLLVKYYPAIDNPLLTHFKVEYWQTFGLTCFNALLKEDYDIVHTSLTMDAFAASLNRSIKGTPFVPVLIQGEPLYADARRSRRLFQRVVNQASRLVTISNFVNDILKRDFGADGVMIPCPVDTSKFYFNEKEKNTHPRILCTATLIMERKRVPLLVKAFEILIEHMPDAILQLAGETTPEVTRKLLMSVNAKTRASIVIDNITSDEDLASLYRNATITVLPSIREAFGMVTTESLASGTPVVGTRSGGTAEILEDPRVGVMFEPTDGPEELCKALIKCIELAGDPETPKRCSDYAQKYSWKTLGPRYEELDMEVLNDISRKSRQRKKSEEPGNKPADVFDEQLPLNGNVSGAALHKLFLDALDELEITVQAYYEIESCMPRCIYALQWLLTRGIREGNVLVLSTHPHFLANLLNKLNFRTRHIIISSRADRGQGHIDHEIIQEPQLLVNLKEQFDVIVCDDIIRQTDAQDATFQILKKCLLPDGVLVLMTPNVRRCGKRFDLMPDDDVASRPKLEYSFMDVSEVPVKAGFKVLEKSYITGEKHIDKTNTFAHVPLKAYFARKLCRSFEHVNESSKSHLFLALKVDRSLEIN
jgi:glycosyltransferase involved in cell wall biosynthesis